MMTRGFADVSPKPCFSLAQAVSARPAARNNPKIFIMMGFWPGKARRGIGPGFGSFTWLTTPARLLGLHIGGRRQIQNPGVGVKNENLAAIRLEFPISF